MPSSQEERRGTLQLQLSQSKETGTQRQLTFQPVQRTLDSYAVQSEARKVLPANETKSAARGYGSQPETSPLKAVSMAGLLLCPSHVHEFAKSSVCVVGSKFVTI